MILAAQSEAFKQENELAERLHGLRSQMERKEDVSLYFTDRIWVLLAGSVMDEAHASRYLVHPGADKTIYIDEWNSGDDQLRLRWMNYLVALADAVESGMCIDFGGSYHLSIRCALFEDKVVFIKEKLKAARDRQKRYADKRRKPLEFEVDDRVLLKVSPWKGVIMVDKTLHFVEEPVEIMDREIKKLKRKKIALVKVRWNSKRGPEFTWEHEDQMRINYLELLHNWYQSQVALDLGSTRANSVKIKIGMSWLLVILVNHDKKSEAQEINKADTVGYGCDLIEYFMIMVVIVLVNTARYTLILLSLVSTASYVLVLPIFTLYCQRKLTLFEFKDEFLCYWFSAIKEERKQLYMLRSWKPNYWLTSTIGLKRLNVAQIHGLCCRDLIHVY
ncbi:hypothetical protein Tco_0109635 [Tanacetum coccineum]